MQSRSPQIHWYTVNQNTGRGTDTGTEGVSKGDNTLRKGEMPLRSFRSLHSLRKVSEKISKISDLEGFL